MLDFSLYKEVRTQPDKGLYSIVYPAVMRFIYQKYKGKALSWYMQTPHGVCHR